MHCYVCMARACMHIVLRRSADACLIVPILADHPGGAARCHAVRVVRAGLPLRPCRPSSHSREQEVTGEGTVQEEAVAWAEQFPRGGDLSGACYVLYMCGRAFAGAPRISVARIWHAFAGEPSISAARIYHSSVPGACEPDADIDIRNGMHACPPFPVNGSGRCFGATLAARRWRGCPQTYGPRSA